jgi:hypothetical protein
VVLVREAAARLCDTLVCLALSGAPIHVVTVSSVGDFSLYCPRASTFRTPGTGVQVTLPPEPREELVPKATIPAGGVVRSSYAIGQTGARARHTRRPKATAVSGPRSPEMSDVLVGTSLYLLKIRT